ncbi:MAG: hypothetical protein CM1200mP38_1120 [Dehalococcoidia bacterium]|nr:MAG: hypothetical protein CM1200mP38_1120 [Dehalococcoidia bacterium]
MSWSTFLPSTLPSFQKRLLPLFTYQFERISTNDSIVLAAVSGSNFSREVVTLLIKLFNSDRIHWSSWGRGVILGVID